MITITFKNTRHLQKHYNLEFLTNYYDTDLASIKEILKLYLEETPKDLDRIESSLSKGDAPTAKAATHKIKTNVAMLGIIDPVEFIEAIHSLPSDAPPPKEIETLFQVFKSEVMKGLEDIKTDYFSEK